MLASPPLPAPLPKFKAHSPPGVLPGPTSIVIVPWNAAVSGSNALISLVTKLKLPTSRSPPNYPDPAGARRCRYFFAASVIEPETGLLCPNCTAEGTRTVQLHHDVGPPHPGLLERERRGGPCPPPQVLHQRASGEDRARDPHGCGADPPGGAVRDPGGEAVWATG
jgi:hypothetical protein